MLKDRTALVTGGAMGIGSGVVERFVAEGARVAICDIAEEAGAARAAALGERARDFRADVADRAAWDEVVAAVEAAFGRGLAECRDAVAGRAWDSRSGGMDFS